MSNPLPRQVRSSIAGGSGGADYARKGAEECGIADRFVAFLPKPNFLLDDQEVVSWRYRQTVHPANYAAIELTDIRSDRTR